MSYSGLGEGDADAVEHLVTLGRRWKGGGSHDGVGAIADGVPFEGACCDGGDLEEGLGVGGVGSGEVFFGIDGR